ncbi:MAG: protein-L-isoaspartate(D-aspartate) O-methyltransferase [Candidatus Paceibacterota bacterium]
MNKKELIEKLKERGIKEEILKVIEKVDRKDFISEQNLNEVYEDHPLSIGYGQTISQPYTVAFMLQELELKKGDKVLEIGTGSGWNAALISCLIGEEGRIYSVEIIKELADKAKEKLKNYENIVVLNANASRGLVQHAPYNKIILTAAPKKIPEELKKQLANEGILLAPVGEYVQKLLKLTKQNDKFVETEKGDFIFVPLVSQTDK